MSRPLVDASEGVARMAVELGYSFARWGSTWKQALALSI